MFDVTILGLGPVGCTLAIFLAEAGLKVAAVERDETVYRLPRAVNLDGEIIRAFQRVGRASEVNAMMQPVRDGDRAGFADPDRNWLFGQDMPSFGSNGWQPTNMFDQPEFENYLRQLVLTHENVTTYIGFEAEMLSDIESGPTLKICRRDEQHELSARFLVGCDGASSFVRRELSIESKSLGYDCDWLVVDITTHDNHTLGNDTLQVCDPDRITTYVCTKDPYRRWEFKLLPGETREEMLDLERVMSLIDPWTPRGTYDIRRTAVYQFHASVATRWRAGNCFIAGDAAHQTPPFLGQGMNAGMRDAINLTWKLPLVVNGISTPALLDTYESERFSHAHDLIDWAVSIGKLMDHLADKFAAEREGRVPPPDPQLGNSGYGQGRSQPPITQGIVCREQVSGEDSVGHLFRQPVVRCDSGGEQLLDDLLGSGFSIVTSNEEELALNGQSLALREALGINVVSTHQLEAARGKFDPILKMADAVVIRPDKLVFGRTTDSLGINDLLARLGEQMTLTM